MDKSVHFRKIDDASKGDHYYLENGDECLYLFEYTSGRGYSFGEANNLVSNLKKPPSKRTSNPAEFRHKTRAIQQCAALFGQCLNPKWLINATLVPVPPSKDRTHPEYDDRMLQICRQIPATFPVDVRELVVQNESIRAAHESPDDRPSITELVSNYTIDETLVNPTPTCIAIVDDVLTAGAHFKAMQRVLATRFPGIPMTGIFVARRIFSNDKDADF